MLSFFFYTNSKDKTMPRAYSVDLREKVLQHIEKHHDKKTAGHIFQVGIATIYRWILQKKQKGHLKPIRRKYAYKKLDDELLSKYVEKHPDYFLSEIADYFSVTPQTIFYALKRLKITRKKKLLAIRKEMKRNGKLL